MRHCVRALLGLVAAISTISAVGCARASAEPPAAPPVAGAASAAPVRAPRAGITGCVESRELKAYVLALEARRLETRRAALAALGATDEERRGVFGDAGASELGKTFEANGRRYAIAAQLALHFEPKVTLARQGTLLRRITERPRAHPTPVLACGVQRCPREARSGPEPARPLLIELEPAEAWGDALELGYDYWWADVRYDRAEPCASASAASSTP